MFLLLLVIFPYARTSQTRSYHPATLVVISGARHGVDPLNTVANVTEHRCEPRGTLEQEDENGKHER